MFEFENDVRVWCLMFDFENMIFSFVDSRWKPLDKIKLVEYVIFHSSLSFLTIKKKIRLFLSILFSLL
jgi:hypothetical protein